MELVKLSEFMHLCRLDSNDLITLLENGELTVTQGVSGELLIDIESLTPEALAKRTPQRSPSLDPDSALLLEEIIASELATALDSIIEEALQIAIQWQENRLEADS